MSEADEVPEEDLPHVLTAFTVIVDHDGRVHVSPSTVMPMALDHLATLVDIETYASQIAREAGRLMLVRELTPPPAPTAAEVVADALRRRGAPE